RVGHGESARRDRLRPVGEILDAGVRVAVVIGADRADNDADRALERCYRRALAAGSAELAVTRSVLRRHHVMVDEDDLAADRAVGREAEGIDAVEIDDLASDSLWARRATVAKGGDHQLLRERRDDFCALRAADPDRHGEGLNVDVGET